MTPPSPVGMIGLGLMGTALAARLREAGTAVIGFDVDPAKCKSFGGEPAASVEEVMSRCPIVIVAVFNAEQVELVLDGFYKSGLAEVVLCTTTCAPDEIVNLSNRAAQLGLRFI